MIFFNPKKNKKNMQSMGKNFIKNFFQNTHSFLQKKIFLRNEEACLDISKAHRRLFFCTSKKTRLEFLEEKLVIVHCKFFD